MRKDFDFDVPDEFGCKTAEELYEAFMDECPATEDSYVNVYGAFYSVMRKILPTSKDILMWMAFNCELDRGRIAIQTFNQARLIRELGISQVSYFKCIKDLKEHDVIRGCRAIYHINPRYVWRGSNRRRLEFMSRYPYIKNERAVKEGENEQKTGKI